MSGPETHPSSSLGALAPEEVQSLPALEKFNILKKLATGGMAGIYVAQRKASEELCVIKTLHDHLAKDSVVSSRFLREAHVASLLHHANIARLLHAQRENGVFYLAMEFIAGHDLESMMFKLMEQRKMLPPELSIRVSLDVLEGLEYAHRYIDADGHHLEIVHRDLSPRNVMITYGGDVKIIDFGLARTNLGEFRTAPGMVLGTLRYMSPEQAVAEPVDRRSDIYSWAVVLYEMLSGRPLVIGNNAQEILHAVVTKVPPPLSELNDSLPKALDAVLAKGLEKDRNARFDSAKELAAALVEAAPELCETKRPKIGKFVASMFPNARGAAEDMLRTAIARHHTDEPTRMSVSPEFEPTRAGQSEARAVAEEPPPEATAMVSESYQPTALYLPTSMVMAPPKRTNWMVLAVILMTAVVIVTIAAVLAVRPKPSDQPELIQSPMVEMLPITAESKPKPVEVPVPPDAPKAKKEEPKPVRKAPPDKVVQERPAEKAKAPSKVDADRSPSMALFEGAQYERAWNMLLKEAGGSGAAYRCVADTMAFEGATSDRGKFAKCHELVRGEQRR